MPRRGARRAHVVERLRDEPLGIQLPGTARGPCLGNETSLSEAVAAGNRAGSATASSPRGREGLEPVASFDRIEKHSATATTGNSRPFDACTVMMRTGAGPCSGKGAGGCFAARRHRRRAPRRGAERPCAACASASMSSALSTFAATARSSARAPPGGRASRIRARRRGRCRTCGRDRSRAARAAAPRAYDRARAAARIPP